MELITRNTFPILPADYYLADGGGFPIASRDKITVDKEDGSEEKLPLTLQMYVRVSNIKYQSRAKFYCVEKEG